MKAQLKGGGWGESPIGKEHRVQEGGSGNGFLENGGAPDMGTADLSTGTMQRYGLAHEREKGPRRGKGTESGCGLFGSARNRLTGSPLLAEGDNVNRSSSSAEERRGNCKMSRKAAPQGTKVYDGWLRKKT